MGCQPRRLEMKIWKAIEISPEALEHLAAGRQKVVILHWPLHYRGELLMCAWRKPKEHPLAGMATCTVYAQGCRPMVEDDAILGYTDFRGGRFTVDFRNLRRIKPIEVWGNSRFFDLELPEDFIEYEEHPLELAARGGRR